MLNERRMASSRLLFLLAYLLDQAIAVPDPSLAPLPSLLNSPSVAPCPPLLLAQEGLEGLSRFLQLEGRPSTLLTPSSLSAPSDLGALTQGQTCLVLVARGRQGFFTTLIQQARLLWVIVMYNKAGLFYDFFMLLCDQIANVHFIPVYSRTVCDKFILGPLYFSSVSSCHVCLH